MQSSLTHILYSNKFLIQTKNRLYNFNVFNFRVESYLKLHPRTFLKYHLPNIKCVCVCVSCYIYILYCLFSISQVQNSFFCGLACSLQYAIDVVFFYDLFGWVYRQPTMSFKLGRREKNDSSDSSATPLGPKIKITRIVFFTEYIRDKSILNILLKFTFPLRPCSPNKFLSVLLYFQRIK